MVVTRFIEILEEVGIVQSSCLCAERWVEVSGQPVLRFKCHCKSCQKVYGQPAADIVVVKSSQIRKPVDPLIQFARHRLPPSIRRGVCPACLKPVVAFLPLAPFFGLAFLPADNFPKNVVLPEPDFHLFYDRRVADIDDPLPKLSGYWASQWMVPSRVFFAFKGQKSSPM